MGNAEEYSLLELCLYLASHWKKIVLNCAVVVFLLLVLREFLPEKYSAEVTLQPISSNTNGELSDLVGNLGNISQIAGLSIGGGGDTKTAIEYLKSRTFVGRFVEKNKLLAEVMAVNGWDSNSDSLIFDESVYDPKLEKWTRQVEFPQKAQPDFWEIHETFTDEILIVAQDLSTGLVNVKITYFSPYVSLKWLTMFVDDANSDLRNKAIAEAESNIKYLKKQLAHTSVSEMRQTIYNLIGAQAEKRMIAETKKEFAFKVIDYPQVSYESNKPESVITVLIGVSIGLIFSVVYFLLKRFYVFARS